MKKYILLGVTVAIVVVLMSSGFVKKQSHWKLDPQFKSYWKDGKAEISSYELKQARYGEVHEGEAVLIYVLEPFSKKNQVKLDDWTNSEDREDVLKLNFVRKFETGIYPYSTMLSVFNSIETGHLKKLSSSIQEWCGQVYMQINYRGKKLFYQGRSYFETEGDQDKDFRKVLTEDELWNQIKLGPQSLPNGNREIIPSTIYLRFNHHDAQIVNADLSLVKTKNQEYSMDSIMVYQLQYKNPENRTLKIFFEERFPFQILGWEDEFKDIAWNSERKILTTRAKLKKTIRMDYWNKNKREHAHLKNLLK